MSNIESVSQRWRVTWVEAGVPMSLGLYMTFDTANTRYSMLVAEGCKDVKLLRVEEIITQELP